MILDYRLHIDILEEDLITKMAEISGHCAKHVRSSSLRSIERSPRRTDTMNWQVYKSSVNEGFGKVYYFAAHPVYGSEPILIWLRQKSKNLWYGHGRYIPPVHVDLITTYCRILFIFDTVRKYGISILINDVERLGLPKLSTL